VLCLLLGVRSCMHDSLTVAILQGLISEMAALREQGDIRALSVLLQTIFQRENVGGFANEGVL
jgi:hypothetical protein